MKADLTRGTPVSDDSTPHALQLGIFLPVANNGWIISASSPQFEPTWELNRDVTLLAEEMGLDYVFSMAKWRGIEGTTDFWGHSVESTSLMAGLAAVTKRVHLVCSIAPTIIHPAVFAKMAATLDDMSNGRLSVNIVSASNIAEYTQMGLYPEDFESYRYEYTEEWLRVTKMLWTQPRVTYHGRYFSLEDCRSDPKPRQKPHPPIVCATNSDRGLQFIAEECNEAFIGGTPDVIAEKTRQIHALAQQVGRPIGTHKHISVIQADTDEEAEQLVESYRQGADWQAIDAVYGRKKSSGTALEAVRAEYGSPRHLHYYTTPVVGGPETVARGIEAYADAGIDGLLLSFPDFVEGLKIFDRDVMPLLRERGIAAEKPATS
jgi:pyrimidine oxygenase